VAEMPGEAVRRSDNRRLRAQGLYVLGRGRGAQAPPLSPHPIPRSLALTERRKYPAETQPFGAALVQAHLALETNFGCGLTSHWNQSSFPGSFTDWKMLRAAAAHWAGHSRGMGNLAGWSFYILTRGRCESGGAGGFACQPAASGRHSVRGYAALCVECLVSLRAAPSSGLRRAKACDPPASTGAEFPSAPELADGDGYSTISCTP